MAQNPVYEMYGTNQMPVGQVGYPTESVQTTGIISTTLPANQISTRQSPSKRWIEAVFICLRELYGTAIFTYVACIAHTNILSTGLIYTALQASSEISSSGGLHLNPAISLAAVIAGKMRTPILVIPMILAQFKGSLLGAGFCLGSQTEEQFLNGGYYSQKPRYYEIYNVEDKEDLYKYCFGEFLLTCVLVAVFLRLFPLRTPSLPVTEEEKRDYQNRKYIHAIFVGLAICALGDVMFRTEYLGLMNPFRAFGPMAVWVAKNVEDIHPTIPLLLKTDAQTYRRELSEKLFKGHWVYWVGPIIAGIVVGLAERFRVYWQLRSVE